MFPIPFGFFNNPTPPTPPVLTKVPITFSSYDTSFLGSGASTTNGLYDQVEGIEIYNGGGGTTYFDTVTGLIKGGSPTTTINYRDEGGSITSVTGFWAEWSFAAVNRLKQVKIYTRTNVGNARDSARFAVLFYNVQNAEWQAPRPELVQLGADVSWSTAITPNRRFVQLDFTETIIGNTFNLMRIVITKSVPASSGIVSIVEMEAYYNV